jgi:hypothetical protein
VIKPALTLATEKELVSRILVFTSTLTKMKALFVVRASRVEKFGCDVQGKVNMEF